MGAKAIYRHPRTSNGVTQATESNSTCLGAWRSPSPTKCGQQTSFTYPFLRGPVLGSRLDWHSRYVVFWQLSNIIDADFCVEALEGALKRGRPDIFNTDQGSQFTSEAFTELLKQHGVLISIDGIGRYKDTFSLRGFGAQ